MRAVYDSLETSQREPHVPVVGGEFLQAHGREGPGGRPRFGQDGEVTRHAGSRTYDRAYNNLMPLITEKLTSATLRFQTSEKIRAGILSGSLKPGERLVERDLAEQLGTSLTVVREALVQLETEGFITKRPNSATHITQLGRSEIEQILVVRRVLEGFAFEEAARKATNGRISLLETLHQEAVEAARGSDYQAYIHADLLWHDAVWQTTGNEALRGTGGDGHGAALLFGHAQLGQTLGPRSWLEHAHDQTFSVRRRCRRQPDLERAAGDFDLAGTVLGSAPLSDIHSAKRFEARHQHEVHVAFNR